jgi:hypothetical protein
VDFAWRDIEGDAFEDKGAIFESGVEVLDVQAHGVVEEIGDGRWKMEEDEDVR